MSDGKKFDDPLSGLAFAQEDEVGRPLVPSQTMSFVLMISAASLAGVGRRDSIRRPSSHPSTCTGRRFVAILLILQHTHTVQELLHSFSIYLAGSFFRLGPRIQAASAAAAKQLTCQYTV